MYISTFGIHIFKSYTGGYFPSLAEAFSSARKHAVSAVDVFSSEFLKTDITEYIKYLKDNSMSVSSLISVSDLADYKQAIKKGKNDVITALKTGTEKILLVPRGGKLSDGAEKTFEYLKEISEFAHSEGLIPMIENYSDFDATYCTVDDVLYYLENVPHLKYTFDTGNFLACGIDTMSSFDKLKDKIIHVHIKDLKKDKNGMLKSPMGDRFGGCVTGSGCVPIKEIINSLDKDGYKGALSIEYQSVAPVKNEILDSADFIKELI